MYNAQNDLDQTGSQELSPPVRDRQAPRITRTTEYGVETAGRGLEVTTRDTVR